MSTNFNVVHPNYQDPSLRHEYTRPLQPCMLMITLSSYNLHSESIEGVLAKLQKIQVCDASDPSLVFGTALSA